MTIAGKQMWLGTFKDENAALAAVARARGGNLPAVRTVGELAARWDELDPRERTAETVAHRAAMVAGFVRVHGRELLESVSPASAQAWATARPGSVRYLRSMFGCAVRLELLERNVWEKVTVRTGKRPRRAFTNGEVVALAMAAEREWPGEYGAEVAQLYMVAAAGGLRLSEAATVRVCDVRGLGRLSVEGKGSRRRTAMLLGFGHQSMKMALERAVRRGPRGPMTVEELQSLETLLFRSEKGRPLSRGTVSKMHKRVVERAGLEDAPTFHGLRHFYATALLDAGGSDVDVAMAMGHYDELGHADARYVRETYGHPDQEAALRRLENITTEGSSGRSDTAVGGAGAA